MIDRVHYYCAPHIFLSILKSQEIWLTSLTLSNDNAEGTWMLRHWIEKFDQRVPAQRLKGRGAKEAVEMRLDQNVALGICFSEERDQLSQWRGYAQDGAGFSVTFDRCILEKVARASDVGSQVKLVKISYGRQDTNQITAVIKSLHSAFSEDADLYSESSDGIGSFTVNYSPEKHSLQKKSASDLFTVKNGAFKEEKEWRLLTF